MRARNHIEGTADFCLITETPMDEVLAHLEGSLLLAKKEMLKRLPLQQ